MGIMLQVFEGKIECPRCNDGGGGLIYKAELSPIQKTVYICDECDALWEDPDQISRGFVISLGAYAKKYGYTYDTIDVKKMNYYWYDKKCKGN
jgi:predicted RNA-binding Zn-ribbon protein involved in translation (DUF1610 family)